MSASSISRNNLIYNTERHISCQQLIYKRYINYMNYHISAKTQLEYNTTFNFALQVPIYKKRTTIC